MNVEQQLETLRDYIRWGVSRFTHAGLYFGHGTDNALDESLSLVLHTLGIPQGSEVNLLDAKLTLAERQHVLALIDKRVDQRIPVPYLTGEAWFAGLSFIVDKRVIIPRSPIAELIKNGFEPWLAGQEVFKILDLCTGSGCIGIASAHYFESAQVDLVDLSADALVVAKQNIQRYDLSNRVQAIQSDLFGQLTGRRYQLIVSNPPYVDLDDLHSMPAEYQHEPELALGSGNDGLEISRHILAQAAEFLTDEGVLIVEVGNSCVALEQAYPDIPFTWIEFEHGGHGVFVFNRQELISYQDMFQSD